MDPRFLSNVKTLWDKNLGSRKIAETLNSTRYQVQKAYKALGIYDSGRKKPSKSTPQNKTCKICQQNKSITKFRKRNRVGKIHFECYCIPCEKEYNKIQCKKRYVENKVWWREYRKKNKDRINSSSRQRYSQLEVKLRRRCSHAIRMALKSKKETSCMNKLPFSIEELKAHLEQQFESWMTWNNWGLYNIETWDDNDPSTWTWQIDHIIPQSKLPYDSMDHPNFQKCWKLSNLRPLNSKENLQKSNN